MSFIAGLTVGIATFHLLWFLTAKEWWNCPHPVTKKVIGNEEYLVGKCARCVREAGEFE